MISTCLCKRLLRKVWMGCAPGYIKLVMSAERSISHSHRQLMSDQHAAALPVPDSNRTF